MNLLLSLAMQRNDFEYKLPQELIAQYPLKERSASRLLCLDASSGKLQDRQFSDFPNFLTAQDLLVFNNTRVIPARIYGRKETGGKVEVLVERVLDDHHVWAHVRASKSPRVNSQLILDGDAKVEVIGRQGDLFQLRLFGDQSVQEVLDAVGHIPLPPYIHRGDTEQDKERYQTVYGTQDGAVAAPTAGLHFDQKMLDKLTGLGVEIATVTLHVGAGTFQPVRVEKIEDHKMHAEYVEVSDKVCKQVNETRKRGGRVIAVGTTSVRCLETAFQNGLLQPFVGDTDIFIYPGIEFKCVDALLTNFHLPQSTLLMLVCAFAGMDVVMNAYQHAIKQRYRFFSYGDAMLLTR